MERNKTHFIFCAVLGLKQLFGGVLRVFDEINFSIVRVRLESEYIVVI